MTSILEALQHNPYPGRLILLARTLDGELTAGYALTGRSDSSRARRIESTEAGETAVVPVGAQNHDALRHYIAATADERWTVYGNGEQVAEVAGRLVKGLAPSSALEELSYEPDPPIYTPRITAVVDRIDGRAWFGATRRPEGERESADTVVASLGALAVGQAVLLSTYESDGEHVSTSRRHLDLSTSAQDAAALLAEVWAALDPRFLVAATAFAPLRGVRGAIRHA
ncbi:IMP cyclohydrolase [Streptomyces xylophagus]|uniref:IMP cyclohydrolase n=1 Tax=Streptomyces xylophagus TaxID=285514 RepID=UPI00068CF857|nr:IMP cyclohydrolase [Streptomyces xylophagus]